MNSMERERALVLPMIPLRGLSVFPNMVLHFDIGREKSINALEKAMITNQQVFLVSHRRMKIRICQRLTIFII